jgi:uncharacterized protein DUF6894
MPQFFFHVRHDRILFEDRQGGEFLDIAAAWNWALLDVRSMIDEDQFSSPIDQNWVEICDAAGVAVAALPFARVVSLN